MYARNTKKVKTETSVYDVAQVIHCMSGQKPSREVPLDLHDYMIVT